jgi:cold shock protein
MAQLGIVVERKVVSSAHWDAQLRDGLPGWKLGSAVGGSFPAHTSYLKGLASMATGTVKWFNDQKGYGFIASEKGTDVFVHHTVIEGQGFKTLEENESVEYDAEDSDKGLKATKVRRLVEAR